ncbi:MAG: hypothetical protein UV57_C0004G0017 [Parcubacteria group bacterium GW2011_GWD2_43_10]|uniref:EamA domain-containing protein n=4 Tax=Candidatus Vebleniibacteriota TaxID=1817921 RepID=A0A1G2Q664_9BACT|nr:MAG: hypothetical protein UV47_C0005G0009 [Parcubacteria group bacterium GW2011_GWA2_42_80]KKS78514.1 MAG: hypothetical protein UV52_C0038G0005 [Parcubacteria group bacterium GW2011_GWD1_42_9]KKS83920.1 MAG: hypothetical protein UV57_C0004G0017 [Parcubacteria group bacterium GW2011_GWD2_43_10]KKS93755.1 MAG: hypothetical protein UV69_C0004G0018 [Parcubacteria group bacterium GW2011_GWE2_43_12]KKT14327.1 MAG: hypothetical protein UV92_C0001G0008 [Parcubacteria group bacterium GW2011_GWA1_43_2
MSWSIFALLAALLTGVVSLLEKKTLLREHATSFAAAYAIVAFIASLFFLPVTDFSAVTPITLVIVAIGTSFGASAFLLIAKAVRHLEISTVSPLMVIEPGLVAILALALLGEKLTSMQVLGIAVLIIGTFFLEIASLKEFKDSAKAFLKSPYIHYVFWAMLLYGLGSIFDRLVLSRLGLTPPTYIIISHLFLAVILLVVLSWKYQGMSDLRHVWHNAGWLVLMIGAITILRSFFQMQAVALASVGLVIAIKRTSALFATVIGGELWHEHNLVKKIIASCIMVLGAVFVVI